MVFPLSLVPAVVRCFVVGSACGFAFVCLLLFVVFCFFCCLGASLLLLWFLVFKLLGDPPFPSQRLASGTTHLGTPISHSLHYFAQRCRPIINPTEGCVEEEVL